MFQNVILALEPEKDVIMGNFFTRSFQTELVVSLLQLKRTNFFFSFQSKILNLRIFKIQIIDTFIMFNILFHRANSMFSTFLTIRLGCKSLG